MLSTANIYHGDLRARNILVSFSGHLIVADFGVSLRLDAGPSCLTSMSYTLSSFDSGTWPDELDLQPDRRVP